jgi:hypothetical protein
MNPTYGAFSRHAISYLVVVFFFFPTHSFAANLLVLFLLVQYGMFRV